MSGLGASGTSTVKITESLTEGVFSDVECSRLVAREGCTRLAAREGCTRLAALAMLVISVSEDALQAGTMATEAARMMPKDKNAMYLKLAITKSSFSRLFGLRVFAQHVL
jgi:hypothetical protein